MRVKTQRLELDFVRRRPAAPWAGALLLALAAAFAADLGYSHLALSRSIEKAELRLARLPAQERAGAKPASPEEIAAARDSVERLSMPWGELFAALESAASDKVALLAIEPDPKSGTVRISGDGKDYLAALGYVLDLSRADALARVELVRHEAKPGAVAFTVSAAWRGGRHD
jgi:hypothetical protein